MKAAKASLTDAPCTKVLTRWILACAATVGLAAGVGAGTQAPPSFAGHWVVTSISPQRPVYDQFQGSIGKDFLDLAMKELGSA